MRDYIKEHGTISEDELLAFAEKYMSAESNVYAVHTDKFFCGKNLEINVNHLTELRIFTEKTELKITRMNIGTEFRWRFIDDDLLDISEKTVYDERHFLDINRKKSKGTDYRTTGGGEYTLPIENAEMVKIRNYLEYDENGIVYISDFRIMGFTQKGSN